MDRKLPSRLSKRIKGLKQKLRHAISNRSKTGRYAQKSSWSSTISPLMSLSTPDITKKEDFYLNFNSDSVPLDQSTPLNYADLKGKNNELKLSGENEFSAPNRTLYLINNIQETWYPQSPEKDNSTKLTTSNNLKRKHGTDKKIKSLKSREVKIFPNFSNKQPLQDHFISQDFLLNNNNMIPTKAKATLFVSNDTKKNFISDEKKLKSQSWKKLSLNDPLPGPLKEKKNLSQNLLDSNQILYNLWNKVWETRGKGLQGNDDVSKELSIRTKTVLKKVHRVMLTKAKKREKEKMKLVVEKIGWAQNIMPEKETKKEECQANKMKRKKKEI